MRKKRTFDDQRLCLVVSMVLRTAREIKGITQAEVAKNTGLERTSIVNIESGTQGTPLHIFMALAKALDIKPAKLLAQIDNLMSLQ